VAPPEDQLHVASQPLNLLPDRCEKTVLDLLATGNSEIVQNCGFPVTDGRDINISSQQGLLQPDSRGTFCIWHIVAPPGTLVSLAVVSFDLSSTPAGDQLLVVLDPTTCTNAAVAATGSSRLLTGWLSPGKVIALGHKALSLYYYSPDTVPLADSGFNLFASFSKIGGDAATAHYANRSCLEALGLVRPLPNGGAAPVDFVQNCGTDQLNVSSSSSGEIVSPANYGRVNRRCIWRVWAPQAQKLKIIVEVDTENISYWDRLFLFNSDCGPLKKAASTEVIEGGSYVINDNAFSVYFYTDENIIPRSFRIFWTAL
jgi:hypothetical protein